MAKVTFVTGVSAGLGLELFDRLIEKRRNPVGIGRRHHQSHRLAANRRDCRLIDCDLSDMRVVERLDLADYVPAHETDIAFVSNAGTERPLGAIAGLASDEMLKAFAVNAVAPSIIASKLGQIAERQAGTLRVINISTGASSRAIAGLSAYCASKSAARMILDCLAIETNAVSVDHFDPGVFDTRMQADLRGAQHLPDETSAYFRDLYKNGRLESVGAIASKIMSLLDEL